MLKHIPFYASLLGRPLHDEVNSTMSHVLVYGAVEAHAMGELGCVASNATIAAETGLKESSVATVLSSLNKAGWIRVSLNQYNHRTGIEPLMTIKPPFNEGVTPLQSPLNIEHSNKNSNKPDTSVSAAEPSLDEPYYDYDHDPETGEPLKPKKAKIKNYKPINTGNSPHGNPKVNGVLNVASKFGMPGGRIDRYAAQRLIKSHGYETVLNTLKQSQEIQGADFAPVVDNLVELERKWKKVTQFVAKNTVSGIPADVLSAIRAEADIIYKPGDSTAKAVYIAAKEQRYLDTGEWI